MHKIISVYRSFIAHQDTHCLVEIHGEYLSDHHDGTLAGAKELATQLNERVKLNNKKNPEDRALIHGEFFYLANGNQYIDIGEGVGDKGEKHHNWHLSQQPGYQQDIFGL